MEDLTTRLLKLPEPQCCPCREAAAEIEMLRQQWREMSSAMMQLRRENLHLKQELADSKRWAMQERSQRWALPDPLTDAERVSVKWAAQMIDDSGEYKWHAATLRGLLERTK